MILSLHCSNADADVKTLFKCNFENIVASSQFEVSAIQFDAIDISGASRKAQQILPFQLNPGTSASLNVYCTAR